VAIGLLHILLTASSHAAKLMFRKGQKKGSLPRPVVAIFVTLHKKAHVQRNIPIADFLKDEIQLFIPTYAFGNPGSKMIVSLVDNSNDEYNKVAILPPLMEGEYSELPFPEALTRVTLRYEHQTFTRWNQGVTHRKMCVPESTYSYPKVSKLNPHLHTRNNNGYINIETLLF
jgi:hypothetical protein